MVSVKRWYAVEAHFEARAEAYVRAESASEAKALVREGEYEDITEYEPVGGWRIPRAREVEKPAGWYSPDSYDGRE